MDPWMWTATANAAQGFVKVFESELGTEALVIQGLLESSGIQSNRAPIALSQGVFPNLGGSMILVRQEDADAARRLIAESEQPDPNNNCADTTSGDSTPQRPSGA